MNPIGRLWPTNGPTWRVSNIQVLDFSLLSPKSQLYRLAMLTYCLLTTCTFLYLDLRKAKHSAGKKGHNPLTPLLGDGWTLFELVFFFNIVLFIYHFAIFQSLCSQIALRIGPLVTAPDNDFVDMTDILAAYTTMSNVLAYASFLSLVKVRKEERDIQYSVISYTWHSLAYASFLSLVKVGGILNLN